MEKGKLFVFEGTDCSGKEEQSKLLEKRLNEMGIKVVRKSYPNYDTPTGKIIGLSYLGKADLANALIDQHEEEIMKNLNYKKRDLSSKKIIDQVLAEVKKSLATGWFPEGAPNVDPRVASTYYSLDRYYNAKEIKEWIDKGVNVILDRYTYSNMGHHGAKIENYEERLAFYKGISDIEFSFLGLSPEDITIFLHMPTEYAAILKEKREEPLDELEKDDEYLKKAEKCYLEIADLYNMHTVECIKNLQEVPTIKDIKTPKEIHEEVFAIAKQILGIN